MKTLNLLVIYLLFLFGCSANTGLPGTPGMPVQPKNTVDEDSTLIGENGPIAMAGYDVVAYENFFDSGDYRNTVGTFYIMLELGSLRKSLFTQLYLNKDKDLPENKWLRYKSYRVSDRFLYIDDIGRNLWGWDYVLFVYHKKGTL